MHAGRAGAPRNIGTPQVRWVDGVEIARVVSRGRSMATKGNNAITIRTIIKEAVARAHGVAQPYLYNFPCKVTCKNTPVVVGLRPWNGMVHF